MQKHFAILIGKTIIIIMTTNITLFSYSFIILTIWNAAMYEIDYENLHNIHFQNFVTFLNIYNNVCSYIGN